MVWARVGVRKDGLMMSDMYDDVMDISMMII